MGSRAQRFHPLGYGAVTLVGADFAIFPLQNPGIISIPLGFTLGWLGTLTSKKPEDPRIAAEMEVRSLTGHGSEKAVEHSFTCFPPYTPEWYRRIMDTTFSTSMGDRGRLVVPAELRTRQGWEHGTPLLLIETDDGVIVATRDQATKMIREQLSGSSMVDELLAERRATAHTEDAA